MAGLKTDPNREYTRKNIWVDTTTFAEYIGYSQLDLLTIPDHKFITTRNQWEIRSHDWKALYCEEREDFAATSDRWLTAQVVNAALEAKVKELVDDNLIKYKPTVFSYLSDDLSNPDYVNVEYHPRVKGKPLMVRSSNFIHHNTMHLDIRWEYLEYAKGGKDMFIIPVSENLHWTLCIVKKNEGTIEFFNSQNRYKMKGDKEVVQETPKWRLVEQAVKKLFGIENLTKIVHEDIPQQSDNFSCGFFLLFYAFAAMKGEKLDKDKYDNTFVVTTFRRSLLKYFLEQVDDRDHRKIAPGRKGKPTSAVTVDISKEEDEVIVMEDDEVIVMEDQGSLNEVVIMEEVVVVDKAERVDSEPSKHTKYVKFRCESPQYNISESEEEIFVDMSEHEPEKVATMLISEPKLEVNFSRKFNLKDLQSTNSILPFEESKALEAVIQGPFVGLDQNGHKMTFNNPTKSWLNMKVFSEICIAISGGNPRFTRQIKDVLTKEVPLNPGLFAVWLEGRKGGPEVISSRSDFYWGNAPPFHYVTDILKGLSVEIPDNPLLKKLTQQRNRRRNAKRRLAHENR